MHEQTTAKQVRRVHPDIKFREVSSLKGEYICDISDELICDLNGKQIATFSHNEEITENEQKVTLRIYESRYGVFAVKGNRLYLNDNFLGNILPEKRRRIPLIILGILGVLLTVAIIIIALIDIPTVGVPILDVRDINGTWKAQGTVAVLDNDIHPDSSGEYEFIIRNSNNVDLIYGFSIEEYYNGKPAESFPLEYRVRVNNDLVGSEDWLSASELNFENLEFVSQSSYRVTLEWRWPFESGNDALDTQFGKEGGQYSLELNLSAETITQTLQ